LQSSCGDYKQQKHSKALHTAKKVFEFFFIKRYRFALKKCCIKKSRFGITSEAAFEFLR